MRPIHFLFDLPWWTGLLVFLLGNLMVSHWYIVGLPICLFGAWTFSKLLPPVDHPEVGFAIIGFPLFFLAMLIPNGKAGTVLPARLWEWKTAQVGPGLPGG
jgi:hypothetical protein